MYVLNLSEENRILSIAYDNPHISKDVLRVEDVPAEVLNSEKVDNYKYINNEFVYNPLPEPEPEPVEPTQLDIIEAQSTYTAMMTGTLLEV